MNIFFLPFAGGSSNSYTSFKSIFNSRIHYNSIEFPGRGALIREPLFTDIHDLVNYIFNRYKKEFRGDYIFFGHSMGSTVGYLLVKKIKENGLPLPIHLFFSGRGGPSMEVTDIRYNLPKTEFWEAIKNLGGCPDEVLKNQEVKDFFEPILRADFQAIETYLYQRDNPFDIPITIMLGKDDKVNTKQAMLWQQETVQPVTIHQFTGGHFFIFDHSKLIAEIIQETLFPTK